MSGRSGLAASVRSMWIAPVIAMAATIQLAASAPTVLLSAAPILVLWFLSPAIAWWLSRPIARREAHLTTEQTIFLRKVARRTWAFFETFVGPDDHWLPPDNYQEHPVASVAHRTSPTNMGMALLANLTAYDFGYVPAGQLVKRTANALGTMMSMERHQGHFYNWYDTRSLQPLPPLYVSAVDSGNLAGHLMTLRAGLLALPDDRIVVAQWFEGLSDTVRTLADAVDGPAPSLLVRLQTDLETAYDCRPTTIAVAQQCLARIGASVAEVAAHVYASPAANVAGAAATPRDAKFWADALVRQCANLRDELAFLAPWSALPAPPRGLGDLLDSDAIPTLRALAVLGDELLPADRAPTSHGRAAGRRRVARRLRPRHRRVEPSGRRASAGDRRPGVAMRGAGPHGVRLPLRPRATPAGHRLQRRRAPARRELLRPARLRGAAVQLRRDCAGTVAAGKLVRARAPAHDRGGAVRAPVVERVDVRVPDAAAGDAYVREHAARRRPIARRSRGRSSTGSSAACRGASRNPDTTRSTQAQTTSTAPSACPAWG